MAKPKAKVVPRGLELPERRAFMKLPLPERRRRMAEQAAKMVAHYERPKEVRQRQEWQGDDLVEGS